MNFTRRRLLRAGAVGATGVLGTLAGCVGGDGSDGGDGNSGDGSDGGDGSSGDDGDGTAGSTTTEQGLTLPTLDVGGSPGGEVVVKPPGTVTLLDFFATWCAPCKPQMGNLREVDGQFPEVHMLSITSERDREAIRSFWREYEGTWPVAQDTELVASSEYSANQVPTMIVLDAEGNEVWRHVGLAATDTIAEQLTTAGATRA